MANGMKFCQNILLLHHRLPIGIYDPVPKILSSPLNDSISCKMKLDDNMSSAIGSALGSVSGGSGTGHGSGSGSAVDPGGRNSGGFVSRPRMKRVHIRDLLFLMENDKDLKRSPLLWKAHCS